MVKQMVALGSSFAAGPGIRPTVDRRAGRSGQNYAHLVAAALGADLVDATVSGATTQTILNTSQGWGPFRFAPQIESLPAGSEADLVTITAGGNDLGYLGSLSVAAYGSWLADRPLTRRVGNRMRAKATSTPPSDRDVTAAAQGLADVVHAVLERAPRARVLLVGYLSIIGTGTRPSPMAPFTPDELALFRTIAEQVGEAFAVASRQSGAEFVDVAAISDAHAVGSAEPWVQGFTGLRRGESALFHPNLAGMRAVSEAILSRLGSS